ncbi:adenosine receptor A2a-like, partial [Argonauta hians]
SPEFPSIIPAAGEPSYIALEAVVAALTVLGNAAVLLVFVRHPQLRTPSNYYIVSLAVADLLVGLLAIPFAVLGHVGLPRDFNVCLFMNSLLMLLCTASILSLVALTVDRYWAIFKPFHYKRSVNRRTSAVVICISWILSILIGLFPVFGWNKGRPPLPRCFFLEVMDLYYLLFIYVVTILFPSFFIIAVYLMIYRTVRRHLRIANHQHSSAGVQSKESAERDAKTAKSVLIIVFLFLVSWFPLYTINAIMLFCGERCNIPPKLMNFSIILSHANSVWNPGLYAWGLSDFREALYKVVCPCRSSSSSSLRGRRASAAAVSGAVASAASLRRQSQSYNTHMHTHSH